MTATDLEDLLDRLVAEYADDLQAGRRPDRAGVLGRVPPQARPGLERCLKMIETGIGRAPAPGALLIPGARLGRFEIVRELGRGGMSLVFLARDPKLERAVALKVLRPPLALEPRHVERFRREALAAAALAHPHVVAVHDVGEEQGFHYLAMESVEGPSLATVLEALPRDRRRTAADLARATARPDLAAAERTFEEALAQLLAPVAQALAAAHRAGLVHRDVKPSNVLLHRDGRAVIADFGLAKGEGDAALSVTGDPLGTPHYMSPEQVRAARGGVDHRSDVYSLGVTLYEALSGRRPFEGESVLEVLEAIRETRPPSLRSVAPHCPRAAAAVVRRAMAHEPEDRYGTMDELAADLELLARAGRTRAEVDEGGPVARALTQLRLMSSGVPYEYRSARTFLGLPLVHVNVGPQPRGAGPRCARGWFALSTFSAGGVAVASAGAVGLVSIAGGFSGGLVSVAGGMSLALLVAFAGGLSAGLVATAGLAAGFLAVGGMAWGYAAVGGYARGRYAAGGDVAGESVLGPTRSDPEAEAFFGEWLPWVVDAMR